MNANDEDRGFTRRDSSFRESVSFKARNPDQAIKVIKRITDTIPDVEIQIPEINEYASVIKIEVTANRMLVGDVLDIIVGFGLTTDTDVKPPK